MIDCAPHPLVVVRKTDADLLEEPAIDLEDNLEMPWQQRAEERQGPLLERFDHQRVVRIRKGLRRHMPREVPVHRMLVDEEPHQLRDGDCRMRVVQLSRELLVESLERVAGAQVQPQHVLE